jgi:peptide/nickel transport system permease protein
MTMTPMDQDPESEQATEAPFELAIGDGEAPATSPRGDAWRRFRRNKLALVGLGIIGVLVFAAIFAPLITFYPYDQGGRELTLQPPSKAHWFGTDNTGRDVYTRVVYGARVSLKIGVFSALLATSIGVIFGAFAGFSGRWIDSLLMRFTDILLALPYIIIAIVLVLAVGQGENNIIIVLGFLGWMGVARLIRSSVIQVKSSDFVDASRAMGCSNRRILWRHVVPNAIQPVIAYSATLVGTAVLSEAALSFLGIGAIDPSPAWGLQIQAAKANIDYGQHTLLFPGLAIFLTVIAFVLVGDGLRDAFDPKLKR